MLELLKFENNIPHFAFIALVIKKTKKNADNEQTSKIIAIQFRIILNLCYFGLKSCLLFYALRLLIFSVHCYCHLKVSVL